MPLSSASKNEKAPSRRRTLSQDNAEKALATVRVVTQNAPSLVPTPSAVARPRYSNMKRWGTILGLVAAVLLFISSSSAKLEAYDSANAAQELLVINVDVAQATSDDTHANTKQNDAVVQAVPNDTVSRTSSPSIQDSQVPISSLPIVDAAIPPSDDTQGTEESDEEQDSDTESEEISAPLSISEGKRGIILCLHNGIAALGASLIRDLRCMGNNEKIQIYHCLPSEMSDQSRRLLTSGVSDIEIVDVCTDYIKQGKFTPRVAGSFRSYWIKPLALLHTYLDEVILLDADAIPMQDPAGIRSLPGYVATGTTFFYDRVIGDHIFFNKDIPGKRGTHMLVEWINSFDYKAYGLSGPEPSEHLLASAAYKHLTCHEMDSSMVLVDKRRAGKALDVLWSLITGKRDFSWGDKESFWLAFEFSHVPYFFSPWSVSVISSEPNNDMELHPETLCGSIAHYVPIEGDDPELLYVNGKALLLKSPLGPRQAAHTPPNQQYNPQPTHMTPRHRRAALVNGTIGNRSAAVTPPMNGFFRGTPPRKKFPSECLVGLGSTPLPDYFQSRLLHRRELLKAAEAGELSTSDECQGEVGM